MAFENSSASDPIDLLQKLVVFLVANGWTQDRSASEGSGWTASLHKSANYVHFRATMPGDNATIVKGSPPGSPFLQSLAMSMGTGFSSGSVFNDQNTGTPKRSDTGDMTGVGMPLSSGPYTNYFFFSDSGNDNVVVVVEKQAGIYGYLGWGASLNKKGTWTGGPYFFGSSSIYQSATSFGTGSPGFDLTADPPFFGNDNHGGVPGYVRVDVDSFTGKWISIYTSTTAITSQILGYTGKTGAASSGGDSGNSVISEVPCYNTNHAFTDPTSYSGCLTSSMDGRANLLPIVVYAQRDGSGPGYSPIGEPPLSKIANGVGKGFAPGSDYAIGSDTYTMFPKFAVQKFV